jgi:hypothetical protein
MAMFSLRFLSEDTLNEFFKKYYQGKNDKLSEVIKLSKKEKIKKLRSLASNLKTEEKEKIISSSAAKQAERSGLKSLLVGGAVGAVGVAGAIGTSFGSDLTHDAAMASSHSGTSYAPTPKSNMLYSVASVLAITTMGILGAALLGVGIGVAGAVSSGIRATTIRKDELLDMLKNKKGLKEEVTSKGDVAKTDNEATKESEGSSEEPKEDNADVYPAEDHTEKEEVEEVIVEECDDVEPEIKDGNVVVKDHDHADAEGKKVRDELIDGSFQKVSGSTKDEKEKVEPKVEGGKVGVKDHDHADAEGKKVRDELIESQTADPLDLSKADTQELNDAGSDTITNDGSLDNPNEENLEKAEPEDVTTGYKSIKEAFLLEDGYFSKDSKVLVTAEEKRIKLENQLSLLIARESNDVLYEELVRTTILAKKLQEQIKDRYSKVAKEKATELFELREENIVEDDEKSIQKRINDLNSYNPQTDRQQEAREAELETLKGKLKNIKK